MIRGYTQRRRINSIATKAMTSTTKVTLISSRLASATIALIRSAGDLGVADEDEDEDEVDEVHGFNEADDQEHGDAECAGCLGLARLPLDGCVAGQPVSDGCADGASAERDAGADQRPCQGDSVVHGASLVAKRGPRPESRDAPLLPVLRVPFRSR